MSIIPAKVAGERTGYYAAKINAMAKAGADRIYVLGGVPAMAAGMRRGLTCSASWRMAALHGRIVSSSRFLKTVT